MSGFASGSASQQRHGPAVDPNSLLNDTPAPPAASKDGKNSEPKPSLIGSKPADSNLKSTETAPNLDGAKGTPSSKDQEGKSLQEPEERSVNPPPPPAPHYFDTFTLVSRLHDGGFTKLQSTIVMELVRTLLSHRFSMARENLVSRSHFENDSYLFKAACSELRTEIQTLRQKQLEKMRSERQAVQTEFDLLNQKFMEEVMELKNELNGMFNDRKIVNRAEQRAMENKIQELNYKITVMINSDLKSDIEQLRWVTTRRALIAIGLLASFIVAMIKFAGNSTKDQRKKKKQSIEPTPESGADAVGTGFPKQASFSTEALLHGGSTISTPG